MAKKSKSLATNKGKRVFSEGEVRDTPLAPKKKPAPMGMGRAPSGGGGLGDLLGLLGQPPPAGKGTRPPPKPTVGGRVPPEKPKAKDAPRASKPMAIGERPVMAKTAAKMSKMKGRY